MHLLGLLLASAAAAAAAAVPRRAIYLSLLVLPVWLPTARCGVYIRYTAVMRGPVPISPNRGVRRVPRRLGGSVTLRSKTVTKQQIRNKIITGGTG
jgi:hypothetical protein